MTDLKNGKIDIYGYEVNAETTPEDIKRYIDTACEHYNKVPSGKMESFYFSSVSLFDSMFSVTLRFWLGKLDSIRLESDFANQTDHSWKKTFELNSKWLEEQLGPANTSSDCSRGYRFNVCRIRSMFMSDSRCGEDAFIDVNFGE